MKRKRVMSACIVCSLVLAGTARAVESGGISVVTGLRTVAPFEVVPEGETKGVEQILGVQAQIQKQLQAKKPGARGQHPKAHGCAKGVFQVRGDIPSELRVGVFKEAREYDVLIRYSNGREFDDRKPESSHGMAIKLLGVEGEKVMPGEEDSQTQDFLLVDSPTFFSRDPESLGKFMVALMRAVGAAVKAGKDPEEARDIFFETDADEYPEIPILVERMQRAGIANPLWATYHSATPYLLGNEKEKFMVRYKAVPTGAPERSYPVDKPNGLAEAMANQLGKSKRSAAFEFRIVRYQGDRAGAAEDPTREWDSSEEVAVADLNIPPQDVALQSCEELSFTPWHTLAEHQPMGGINRARFPVYLESVKMRGASPSSEPTAFGATSISDSDS